MNPIIPCPLAEAAKKFSTQPALIYGPRAISFRQLDLCVSSTAKQLKKLGVHKGQRVALADERTLESIVILWALWRIGVVVGLLSNKLPEDAFNTQLKKINAQLLFTSEKAYMVSRRILQRKFRPDEVISFDVKEPSSGNPEKMDLSQPATIIFTSGSSSEPKAALHTLGNHVYSALGANMNISIEKGDKWLLSLPLYHVSGVSILFRCLLGGGTIIIPREDEDILPAIRRNKITHVSLVTTQLFRLMNNGPSQTELSSIKCVLLGGGPIPPSLLKDAAEFELPVYPTYGLTEMASQVATANTPLKNADDKLELKVLKYRDLKISGQGEILVKGETLFKGYVEAERIKLPLNSEGWFETGDLGEMDQNGNLKIWGRKDNMFISGGENIQPEEIEKLLNQKEEILEARVIPVKNTEFGFRPAAFIKIRETDKELTTESLRSYLGQQLPKFKIPVAFYPWPTELERENLKISRKVLSELLTNPQRPISPIS